MPGASRVGIDTAGGLITGPGATTVKINDFTACVKGDAVADHGTGAHDNAHFNSFFSPDVEMGGLPTVRAGDAASCGHVATGSSDVFIN